MRRFTINFEATDRFAVTVAFFALNVTALAGLIGLATGALRPFEGLMLLAIWASTVLLLWK